MTFAEPKLQAAGECSGVKLLLSFFPSQRPMMEIERLLLPLPTMQCHFFIRSIDLSVARTSYALRPLRLP